VEVQTAALGSGGRTVVKLLILGLAVLVLWRLRHLSPSVDDLFRAIGF
jgi:hypothetical protein